MPPARSPRGLATLALLKTRFDEGRDHLGMVEPFVEDAVAQVPHESFVAADIAKIVAERCGLQLPTDTVKTVLNRLSRQKKVEAAGGRFVVGLKLAALDVEAARAPIVDQHRDLQDALVSFADEAGLPVQPEDALLLLAQFIAENKLSLLMNEDPEGSFSSEGLGAKTTRLIARFVTEECLANPGLSKALESLTEGMILQDALLLRDVASLPQRFRNLTIILDTPVVFALLGLTGAANAIATKEGLSLLRDAGATTVVYERTTSEVRRILAVYEQKLATAEGRLSLFPTDLTSYVLEAQLAPSDIRMISATLEKQLASLAVPTWEVPRHDRRFTFDEEALAEALADRPGADTDTPRIRHDVDCIAGVLTMRRGRTSPSIENIGAVFCTTSGRVISTVRGWFLNQGLQGVPPLVHQYALTSLAWLKRPAAARGVQLHELAAICAAVLRPSRETWTAFVANLQKLRDDGALTDDETVAIVASEFTEPLLSQLDDEAVVDSDTIQQAIERVRRAYREDAEAAAGIAVRAARGEAAVAQESAGEAHRKLALIQEAAKVRALRVARAIGGILFVIATLLVIAAAVLSVVDLTDNDGLLVKWVARVVAAASVAIGTYSQIHGPSVVDMRKRFEDVLAQRIHRLLMGNMDEDRTTIG